MTNTIEGIKQLSILIENQIDNSSFQYEREDLTHQQLNYLIVINRLKNPSITELANELKLSKPSITVLIDKLSEKGYVYRVRSDKDKRSLHLHMTEKGMRLNEWHEKAHEHFAQTVHKRLNKTEAEIFMLLIKKLLD